MLFVTRLQSPQSVVCLQETKRGLFDSSYLRISVQGIYLSLSFFPLMVLLVDCLLFRTLLFLMVHFCQLMLTLLLSN
jgi:hypothetical protein